jgi:hypothetical protein
MRAEALEAAPDILRHLLEDEDDFDMKDVGQDDPDPSYWHQIDGDYGDPWEYGGSWFNPARSIVWHFEGLETMEQLGIGEVDPDDIEVPPTMKAALDRQFPLDYVDPDGDLDWQERQRRDNERERDRLVGQYQYARAAYLNARKEFPWYEIDVDRDGELDSWLDRKVPDVAQMCGMTEEDFRAMPLANQLIEMTRYFGTDEIGGKFKMSKQQAERELGFRL